MFLFRWSGGKRGVGKRIATEDSVKIINAINEGKLDNVETFKFKYFNLEVPKKVQGVDSNLLNPS